MKKYSLFLLAGIAFLLSACSPYNTQVTKEYDSKHYTQTYKTLQKATQKQSNDWLLWKMQLGFLTFGYFGAHFSIDDLESAEKQFKVYESKGILSNLGANVGATFSNDMAIPYHGLVFEGTLLNFYKALAYSSIGNNAQARIEFNRANDRQRRAKEYYKKEIQKAHDNAVKEANKKAKNASYETNTTQEHLDEILDSQYTNLKNFAVYEDLINPVIPYISGLFFMIEQDYTKSIDLLKESYGISRAAIIAQDMQLLESRKGRREYPKYTWILIEDGDIARKMGLDASIPLLMGSGVNAINLALPTIQNGRHTHASYYTSDMQAHLVGNMSGLFASEFEKQLPAIITRAMVGALVKFTITQSFNELGGDYGALIGLVSTVAFSATTAADTRTSLVLPHNVWVSRISNTQEYLQIYGDNTELLRLPITNDCNTQSLRIASKQDFDSLIKAKPKDFSARIHFFQKYYEESSKDTLCAMTDNIVYIRTHKGTVAYSIIKGE